MRKVNLHSAGMGKQRFPYFLHYLADLELMRTHVIPNVWECANSHKMEIFRVKPYNSQTVSF